MNYFDLLSKMPEEKEALIIGDEQFTYGSLLDGSHKKAKEWMNHRWVKKGAVHVIKEKLVKEQILSFFACFVTGEIPLLVPTEEDFFTNHSHLMEEQIRQLQREAKIEEIGIPKEACVAVATSGTTGHPKIYFRSFESWADYFPVQNDIFGITGDARMFVQGSIAFTGNLNLYLGCFSEGGTIVTEEGFHPKHWEHLMREYRVNCVYLIPTKLMLLPGLIDFKISEVGSIVSGSQSLGKDDAIRLKAIFPQAKICLYYGASELNYISYIEDKDMTDDRTLIGRAFPNVHITIRDKEIYVDTPYHVKGISCPYSLSDTGYIDDKGLLHFMGRKDDILLVRGRKVSAGKIENILLSIPSVLEAVAVLEPLPDKNEHRIVVYIVLNKEGCWDERKAMALLHRNLLHYEMPRKFYVVSSLPKNGSGKVDKKQLFMLK